MRCLLLASFALINLGGCASEAPLAPVAYPPLAQDCSATRIGRVTVEGATPADVAPLAVLEGTLDDPERADRIAGVATELLQARGYPYAKLEVSRHVGCGTELHVTVHTGPRFKIARLVFRTNDDFPSTERVLAVQDGLGTVNAVGGAYLEDRMKRALTALEHRYHEAGWIDATIGAPKATYDEISNEVSVSIPITAGPRYRIGRIITRGGSAADRRTVIEALGLRGGEWYNGPRVRIGINRARHETEHRVELHYEIADHGIVDLDARVK
ncbi:MAG TPA: hypothetical protein VGG74_27825 [Kofleriaceae bacterium]